jgi:hypothetical protein
MKKLRFVLQIIAFAAAIWMIPLGAVHFLVDVIGTVGLLALYCWGFLALFEPRFRRLPPWW